MSIVTVKTFQRLHKNGKVLVEVPEGTQLSIKPIYSHGAWRVEAEKPVTATGGKVFHVNSVEYKELIAQ
jgi:hypothetical protein